MAERIIETEVVVVGAGPGGYTAAFRAADNGLKTVLVDTRAKPGGVCLFEGCIPSKALLHVSALLSEARQASEFGVRFAKPEVDVKKLRKWKEDVVDRLTSGVDELGKMRKVDFISGRASFENSQWLRVEGSELTRISFEHAIVATGSRPAGLPGIDLKSSRVMTSRGALDVQDVPVSLLVVGAGYIGLEMGSVYASLGSRVTVVEMMAGILPGVDRDLTKVLDRKVKAAFENIYLKTKVAGMKETKKGMEVRFEGKVEKKETFEKVLIAVGRLPNSGGIGLEQTSVQVGEKGFIPVDETCRTSDPKIFAIGDVAGQPMLAHKAMREGKVAADVIAGKPSAFDNAAIPAVVFTDPEIAWCGLTESEAKEQGRAVKVTRFPWAASGRAITLGRTDGLTKMIFDSETGQVLGVGIVGPGAGELIAEAVLAVEMAAVAEDVAVTIHAHPTLSETINEVAESFLGQATHIFKR